VPRGIVDLQNVDLQNVDLQNSDLQNVDLQNVDLQNVYLQNVDLQNVQKIWQFRLLTLSWLNPAGSRCPLLVLGDSQVCSIRLIRYVDILTVDIFAQHLDSNPVEALTLVGSFFSFFIFQVFFHFSFF
jgi:uncharacterized protein YjbI with pentapeptide repeats